MIQKRIPNQGTHPKGNTFSLYLNLCAHDTNLTSGKRILTTYFAKDVKFKAKHNPVRGQGHDRGNG